MADAYMEIVKSVSGNNYVPPDSGVPSGDLFVYSDYNQAGSTVIDNNTKSPNIQVGNGAMLQSILKENGEKVETALTNIKSQLESNITKQIEKMVSYENTFKTAIGDVKTVIGTNGVKISASTDKLKDMISQKDMAPKVTNEIDVTPLAEPTKKIAEGVDKQMQYHDKQIDKLDFDKNGTDTLKDVDGNKIIPREASAKYHAEKATETGEMNNTSIGQLCAFTTDMFGWGVEGIDEITGGSLGDVNPFEFLLNQVRDEEIKILNRSL